MNRLYSSLLAATALTFTAAAQQIPNSGFETWEACIPWSPTNTTNTQGSTPATWTVSNVWAGNSGLGKTANTTVAANVDGFEGRAVELNNTFNVKVIPSYITLGKPWSTATGMGSNKDGGTWGGYDFAFRPDGITFMYKSTGSSEQPSAIVYSWKGKYLQANVPANIKVYIIGNTPADKCTMENRDRNILGFKTADQLGEDITCEGDTALISFLNARLDAEVSTWTKATLEIPYKTSDTPEMINVIFSAGDYFSSDPQKDNSLTLDDFAFVYFSRLKSLSVNGTAIPDFDPNKYEYTVETAMPTDASAISTECLGNSGSGKAVVALDPANNKATITVTNSNAGGTDVDGESSHVYTLNFKATEETDPNAKKYDGRLTITMNKEDITGGGQDATVYITPNESMTSCMFLLPDLTILGGLNLGDIKVDDVKMSPENGGYRFDGNVNDLILNSEALGEIKADVDIDGTIDAAGNVVMDINVIWKSGDPDVTGTPDGNLPIFVAFNGKGDSLGTSAIGGIEVDDENAPVEYYNIQGVKVNGDNLAPGFYIVRQGKKVSKIFVK